MLIKPQQLLLLLLFICIGAKAQERTILLQGYVRDAFTNGGIKNVSVILMDEDSTIIDKQTVKYIVGPIIWADRNSMLFPNILYMQIYEYYSKKLSLFFVFNKYQLLTVVFLYLLYY